MKLYYWRYKFSCGEEACVAAASLDEAQEALRNSLTDYFPASGPTPTNAAKAYHHGVVEKMLAGDGYDLVVLEPGRVVWTERS